MPSQPIYGDHCHWSMSLMTADLRREMLTDAGSARYIRELPAWGVITRSGCAAHTGLHQTTDAPELHFLWKHPSQSRKMLRRGLPSRRLLRCRWPARPFVGLHGIARPVVPLSGCAADSALSRCTSVQYDAARACQCSPLQSRVETAYLEMVSEERPSPKGFTNEDSTKMSIARGSKISR